jgi:PEP-CTERM motif
MHKTAARLALATMFATTLGAAQAAWIGFDDLTPTEYPDSWWDTDVNPIDPQAYADQGVVIEGGWLWPGDYPQQSMRASAGTRITFSGASLPTHVSLHVRWLPEDILNIRASGPAGYTDNFHLWGYEFGPSPPRDFGDQRISFSSSSGISSVSFSDSVFMRFPAYVDNIWFGNVAAVPEPAPLLLAGIGVLALWARRRATRDRRA